MTHPIAPDTNARTDRPIPPTSHTGFEDAMALGIGTLLISFGVAMFKDAGLLTGGTAGIAFLIHYQTGWAFGWVFSAINVPFYALSIWRMGWAFTFKTFAAVSLVSVFSGMHEHFVHFNTLNPFYCAVVGGLILGMGFIVLFRHNASLGGVNILALFLQSRYKLKAGLIQLGVDLSILMASVFTVSLAALLGSVLAAIILNMVISFNHRPDRYIGT